MLEKTGLAIFLLINLKILKSLSLIEIPPLAPYKQNVLDDPFEIFEPSIREKIRSVFTPAFYEPKCNILPKVFIEPIYFWPGDTIKLRCVVCIESFAKNGVSKNWAIFQNNIPESIEELDKTLEISKYGYEQWLVLDEVGADVLRNNKTEVSYIPGAKYDPSNILTDTRERRPKMTFEQRDGYLIINNTDISNYGLYRCFDVESHFVLQHVYFLIPITPIYESVGSHDYTNECNYERIKDVSRLDGYHQYRFNPRLLVNSKNCENDCSNYAFDEAKLNTTPIVLVRPDSIDPNILIQKFNLEIFLHWSPWTKCENNQTEKTRTGFCHIRKTKDIGYNPTSDNIYKIHSWLLPIHKLLENVEEFRKNGIMLFSGIMGSLLLKGQAIPQHCTVYPRRTWDELHKAIIGPLMEQAVNATLETHIELSVGLCFRKVTHFKQNYLLFGQQLFQNKGC